MTDKKQLFCRIVDIQGSYYLYAVSDGEKDIFTGYSSSPEWVKHDAGGYHTKEKFDAMFPQGWDVAFSF